MPKVKYPECSSISTLESLPDGTIVRLNGWGLIKYQDTSFSLIDGTGDMARIYGIVEKFCEMRPGDTLIGVDLYVKVHKYEGYYMWAHKGVEIYYYEPTSGKCDCGAVHTSSFPDHHSDWCSTNVYR